MRTSADHQVDVMPSVFMAVCWAVDWRKSSGSLVRSLVPSAEALSGKGKM